jgi:hypothetical protein
MTQTPMATTSRLIAKMEAVWRAIQTQHPETPDVVITIGAGTGKNNGIEAGATKLGHFAPLRWQTESAVVHELFIGGEGLSRSAQDVLGTLLHEAAHAIANVREIQDTSRQGRYHNAKYRAIGEELGLALSKDPKIGWSITQCPDETALRYSRQLHPLQEALTAYRVSEPTIEKRTNNNNGIVAECGCVDEPRKIRLSKKAYRAGAITCGVCGFPFIGDDDEDED